MTTPTTTLLLVRHGQSTWNAAGRWQGQADPPLSDHGRRQASYSATRIGVTDAIVSSPQQRALETATIISAEVGVGPVLVHDDLRERSAGPWSGLTKDEIDGAYPDWLATGQRPAGYESDEELLERVYPAFDQIAAEIGAGTVLVLCHGGVIRAVESDAGLQEGRVPNLSGRVVTWTIEQPPRLGEQIRFLDEDLATGGDPNRV